MYSVSLLEPVDPFATRRLVCPRSSALSLHHFLHSAVSHPKKEERFLQEDRLKSLQEIEELKKLCCTEAEKAKQLRGDELAVQEQERKSTVNQFMVQIQELQHKVKIL